jgi:glucose/arabinose dehydrogenase/PKD repeat protein
LAVTALLLLAQPLTTVGTAQAAAQSALAAGFTDSIAISGLTNPTVVQFASDGSVVVAEKSGRIWSYTGLSDDQPTLVADLSASVDDYWDRGLLGMTLSPNYPADNHIYVLYARDAPLGAATPVWNDGCPTPPGPTTDGCVVSGRLSRLTISGGVSVAEQVLLDGWCQQFPSHSVGALAFAADGFLYVSGGEGANFNTIDYGQFGGKQPGDAANPCGDPPGEAGTALKPPEAQGGALRAQSARRAAGPTLLNGAVLRLDPATGDAAPGNPFAGASDANRRRILAYGLRNPFRMTFRPGANELYIGDVGWKRSEEVNRIPDTTAGAARNFGWPCYEGNTVQQSYQSAGLHACAALYSAPGSVTAPYYSYLHADKVQASDPCPKGGSSISGLAFYPGGNYPSKYTGALFFADHTRNCLWAMLPNASGNLVPKNIATIGHVANPVYVTAGPAALSSDIFYADLDGGAIHRLSYSSDNTSPVAVPKITPANGMVPLVVQFNATGSSDPDGDSLTYQWDFGDGSRSSAATGSHTYQQAGAYQATLTVSDGRGGTTSATVPVLAGASIQMAVKVTSPTGAARTKYRVGDKLRFSASAKDVGGAGIPASNYSWHLAIHHCYTATNCHIHDGGTIGGVSSGTFTAPDHEFPCYLTVDLTVSVPGTGQTMTKSVRVDPQTAQLKLVTKPTGVKLKLSADEFTGTAPITKTFVVGHLLSVSAPAQQTVAGHRYRWQSWSDKKPATHTVVVPASATTLTATYKRG